jgi:hypothetical protein
MAGLLIGMASRRFLQVCRSLCRGGRCWDGKWADAGVLFLWSLGLGEVREAVQMGSLSSVCGRVARQLAVDPGVMWKRECVDDGGSEIRVSGLLPPFIRFLYFLREAELTMGMASWQIGCYRLKVRCCCQPDLDSRFSLLLGA